MAPWEKRRDVFERNAGKLATEVGELMKQKPDGVLLYKMVFLALKILILLLVKP